MDQVVLENKNSVQIREDHKYGRHYTAINTLCSCGDKLIVAPAIYNQAHIKSDPVMVCSDFGVRAYCFSELIIGKQKENN